MKQETNIIELTALERQQIRAFIMGKVLDDELELMKLDSLQRALTDKEQEQEYILKQRSEYYRALAKKFND